MSLPAPPNASVARHPAFPAAVLAALGALAYLLVHPPSGDLAAATYRAQLFAHHGVLLWDNRWYAGHFLPAYSLLVPALGAAIGVRELLALSAPCAAALFAVLAMRTLSTPGAAHAASISFAFGFCAELSSGRVPFDTGAAIALASLVLFGKAGAPGQPFRRFGALLLAAASSLASPVAGAFLALAAATIFAAELRSDGGGLAAPTQSLALMRKVGHLDLRRRSLLQSGALAAAALTPIALLAVLFPEGGSGSFAAGAFWPEFIAAGLFALLLPSVGLDRYLRKRLRLGAAIYALTLAASFLIASPVGGNAVRLGALFGPPLLIGALWGNGKVAIGWLSRRHMSARWLLATLLPLLLYWQLATAIDDQVALAGDPTINLSYYAPLLAQLNQRAGAGWIRVEVPMTGAHWESTYIPDAHISLARGWERQLDMRFDRLFYRSTIGASAYRDWLTENAIDYVALPNARLDSAGRGEAHLIASGLPYLAQVWHNSDWRLYAVRNAAGLVQSPGRLLKLGVSSFQLALPAAGSYRVALHYNRYWSIGSGHGCVSRAPGDWTLVRVRQAQQLSVSAKLSAERLFSDAPACR